MPKIKKPSIAKVKKKADAEWSKYIRYRDGWFNGEWVTQCITCQVIKPIAQMQCGHFVSRRVSLLRFDEFNTASQCVMCNMFNHGEQYKFAKEIDFKYGDGKAEELMAQRFTTKKWTIPELEQVIHDSKEYVNHCILNPLNYSK